MNWNYKVVGMGLADAVTTILLWVLSTYAHVDLPGPVAAAVLTVVSVAAGWATRSNFTTPVVTAPERNQPNG